MAAAEINGIGFITSCSPSARLRARVPIRSSRALPNGFPAISSRPRPCPPTDPMRPLLLFADVFMPDGGIFLDVVGEEGYALLGIEVNDLDVEGAEPGDAALEGAAFPYDDTSKCELADEAAAVPAGRESGDHG